MKQGSLGVALAISVGLGACLLSKPAAASYCTDSSLATLTATAYTTHWNAYAGLACLEEHLVATGDRRAIFASVYTLTTLRMAESIDAGDYGYCDETGEPIGVGRLLARPTATLSLEAQQRRELKQKMFGD